MSERKKKPAAPMRIQNVFIFLLLAIFAVSAIFMTALSARVYRDTVNRAGNSNAARAVAAVIRGAAWNEDAGSASVREEGGVRTLVFADDYGGETYLRRLFCSEGYLWESLTEESMEFDPELGESLVEIAAFEPELKDRLLTVRVTLADGREETIDVCLRAGGAAK